MNFNFSVSVLFAIVIAGVNSSDKIPPKCIVANCKAPPKVCPNGEPPQRLFGGCCSYCFTEPIDCRRLMCARAPTVCPNKRPEVRMPGECCTECTNSDCAKKTCVPPTEYCREGQTPRPSGECCATCKLNCSGIICRPCPAGYKSENSPNSCCPVCR